MSATFHSLAIYKPHRIISRTFMQQSNQFVTITRLRVLLAGAQFVTTASPAVLAGAKPAFPRAGMPTGRSQASLSPGLGPSLRSPVLGWRQDGANPTFSLGRGQNCLPLGRGAGGMEPSLPFSQARAKPTFPHAALPAGAHLPLLRNRVTNL